MKKKLFLVAEIIIIGTIFFFIGKVIARNWGLIKDYSWDIAPALITISIALLVGSLMLLIVSWNLMLRALDMKLKLMKSAKIWSLSHLGRYLPGYIWQFVAMISFLAKEGFSKKRALLSTYLDSGIAVLTAIITALIALSLSQNRYEGISAPLLITALAACIIMLHPKFLEVALNILLTIIKKEKVKVDYSFAKIMVIAACFTLFWFVYCGGFFMLIKSVYPIENALFFDIVFAVTISWVVGFLAVFAPAGIGVREGLLIILLNRSLPEFISPVISIGGRLWMIAGEMICLSIILLTCKIFFSKDNEAFVDNSKPNV